MKTKLQTALVVLKFVPFLLLAGCDARNSGGDIYVDCVCKIVKIEPSGLSMDLADGSNLRLSQSQLEIESPQKFQSTVIILVHGKLAEKPGWQVGNEVRFRIGEKHLKAPFITDGELQGVAVRDG